MFNKSGCEWRMNKAVCWNLQLIAGVEISASESETLLTFVIRFETDDKEINDNSSNTQTTVSSLTHISWQADLSMDFRTLLRWTTPDTPLLLLGEKLPSTLDNRDAAWSSKSTSKIQTTTNSHRCSDWSCETHLSTKTSKCALTRIRTASSVCAQYYSM